MNINLDTLERLAVIADAAKHGSPITWSPDGGETVLRGIARHFVRDSHSAAFLTNDDNVLDAYLRISGVMEHFLPVSDILVWERQGCFVVRNKA